jgi:hypothetical protein
VDELGGTLALRRHWCRPDEPVLLCVPCHPTSVRFDMGGLDWRGLPKKGARAVMDVVGRGVDFVDRDLGQTMTHPVLVVHGAEAGSLAGRAVLPVPSGPRAWVLTPYRIGVVDIVPGPAAQARAAAEREAGGGLLSRARKIAAGAAEIGRSLGRDHPYPPGEPVPLAGVAPVAEIPAARIAGIGLDRRKLPPGYHPRKVPVLRVALHDGSGFDVVAPDDEAAGRLARMTARTP